eukprot:3429873-Pleurochrysis_carterae.AAC.1
MSTERTKSIRERALHLNTYPRPAPETSMLTNEEVVVHGRVVCPRPSSEGEQEGLSQHGPGLPRACASGSGALSIGASRCVRLAACAPL